MTLHPSRILIANDQEWTARSLESILTAEGYAIVRAYTGRQAVDRALESDPDLIILDFQLPDLTGAEVCRLLRQDPRIGWCTPVVLTTAGSNGRGRQVEAFDAGAWDFWFQPFDGPMLLLKVQTFLRARAELVAARQEAMTDPATGLYSARGLAHRIAEITSQARRRQEAVTCIAVSVGSTELVQAAEAAGEMGRTVGRALLAVLRGSDAVGRVSPLDFVVVAPGLSPEVAGHLVERFSRSVTALRPASAPPICLRTRILSLDESLGASPEELVRQVTTAAQPV